MVLHLVAIFVWFVCWCADQLLLYIVLSCWGVIWLWVSERRVSKGFCCSACEALSLSWSQGWFLADSQVMTYDLPSCRTMAHRLFQTFLRLLYEHLECAIQQFWHSQWGIDSIPLQHCEILAISFLQLLSDHTTSHSDNVAYLYEDTGSKAQNLISDAMNLTCTLTYQNLLEWHAAYALLETCLVFH